MTDRLFTTQQLADLLEVDVTEARGALAERLAWGWLKPILDLAARPDPVSDEVFSWAIELGAIAHENPAGRTAYELGDERSQFSAERRTEILQAAASGGRINDTSSSGVPTPLASFPPALPDPFC